MRDSKPTMEIRPQPIIDGGFPRNAIENELLCQVLAGQAPVVHTMYNWCTIKDMAKLCNAVEKLGARLISRNVRLSGGQTLLYLFKSGFTSIGQDQFIIIVNDEKLFDKLTELARKHVQEDLDEPQGRIYTFIPTMQGLKPYQLGIAGVPIERGNYTHEVLEGYDDVVQQIGSGQPFGRLVLLEGPPGTGKTYLVRHMIDAVKDAIFVYAPSSIVGHMDNPGLLPALLALRAEADDARRSIDKIVLVVEDADALLEKRTTDRAAVLSSLLNLTSGMLGDLTNTIIIATFNNVGKTKLDDAILRDGRMMRHIKVGELPRDQCHDILRRLTGDPTAGHEGPNVLSNVYGNAHKETKPEPRVSVTPLRHQRRRSRSVHTRRG